VNGQFVCGNTSGGKHHDDDDDNDNDDDHHQGKKLRAGLAAQSMTAQNMDAPRAFCTCL